MIFTAKTLTTLEYDKIIDMLVECTATEGAKARARALMPTDEYDFVVDRQNKTDDAKRLINAKGYPSFSAPESVPAAADRVSFILLLALRIFLLISASSGLASSAIRSSEIIDLVILSSRGLFDISLLKIGSRVVSKGLSVSI